MIKNEVPPDGWTANSACVVVDCPASVWRGNAIHRTSPLGGPFWGMCTRHCYEQGREPDDIAVLIEQENRKL